MLQVSVLLSVFAIGLRATVQDATYLFRRPGELVRVLLAMNCLIPRAVFKGAEPLSLAKLLEKNS